MSLASAQQQMSEEGAPGGVSLDDACSCWVCGSKRVVPWKNRTLDRPLQPHDLQITDARYGCTLRLCRCTDCGFIFADDDEVADLVALYEQLDDSEYEQTHEPRAAQMRWLLRKAKRARPEAASVLDVGAGTGLLVAEARKMGLASVGVEPCAALVEAARRNHNTEILGGTFPHNELAGRRFDLIFLVDVIEHVAKPLQLLQSCADAMSQGGLLVVVTPDVRSLAARLLRHRWWHFRLAHVGYFDRHTMLLAGQSVRLTVERCFRAKWFFPIGYLAQRLEQYVPITWWNRLCRQITPLGAFAAGVPEPRPGVC